MPAYAYAYLASRQRPVPEPCSDEAYFERLRAWCKTCSDHRVLKDGDECPVCIDGEPR